MAIKTFSDVELALESHIRYDSKELTTRTTKELSQFVGSPEERLKVVHVAGTSGKTSTCYYIRALLETAGQKTGLTVSPHVVSIADRVQIAGRPLDEVTFCRYFDEYFQLVEQFGGRPSYFEIMMVFALWVFDREKVDYAVVETGLGGLHDSSNICRRPDKVCVLTDIGIDHTAVLGNTLSEITRQKVGIVAPGNQLIMYRQSDEIAGVAEKYAENIIYVENPTTDDFRQRNFDLAYRVYRHIANRDNLVELSEPQVEGASLTQVPGRLEIYRRGGVDIILDGAHNPQKMTALVRALTQQSLDRKFIVILAMKYNKDFREVLEIIKPITKQVIVSEYRLFQDTRLGATSADILLDECHRLNIEVEKSANLSQALELALKKASGQTDILATGSLYAVSELRKLLADSDTRSLDSVY